MTTPIDLVLSKLSNAKPAGAGRWTARCPAHDDRAPSLSVGTGDDGRALVHCHAGCTAKAIVAVLGLTMADLMAERTTDTRRPTTPRKHADSRQRPARDDKPAPTFPTADEAVRFASRHKGPCAGVWTYHNANGEPCGMVIRWNLPNGGKDIRPIARTAAGCWTLRAMSEPRPLYALPDLLARTDETVYVVEGEKCADAARSLGLLATTSAGGGGAGAKSDWTTLRGRDVVVMPDHNDIGEKYATTVAAMATEAGAASVRIVRLIDSWAGMPEGGDVVDLIENRGGDAERVRDEIEALASKARAVDADRTPDSSGGDEVVSAPRLRFEPFPVDALPDPARSFVIEAAQNLGCDPSFVALPMLAGMGSAIGNTKRVELKRGWTEPAILWCAIVGDSGTQKSPAIERALRPIRQRQHDAMRRYGNAMTEHQQRRAEFERDMAAWKRGKSTGEPTHGTAGTDCRSLLVR
jgi:hypothetical protein